MVPRIFLYKSFCGTNKPVVLKNEHYGEIYIQINKPSPLSLRVKSKTAELFLIRKYRNDLN